MKIGSRIGRRARIAIICIAATGLGVLAAVALAGTKPTATADIRACFRTIVAEYQWSGFQALRNPGEAGMTITDHEASTTTAITRPAGPDGGIQRGSTDVTNGHSYSAHGELRNARGAVLGNSKKTSGPVTVDAASCP